MGGKMGGEKIANKDVMTVVDMVMSDNPFTKYEVAGSYRRGKTICGDIDVVAQVELLSDEFEIATQRALYIDLMRNTIEDPKEFTKCSKAFLKHLDKGTYKINTATVWLAKQFGFQKNGKPRHAGLVDAELNGRTVPVQFEVYISGEKGHDDYGAQLLMWTGSWKHNVKMRAKALTYGWKLNQYGIFDDDDNLAIGLDEVSIFDKLGLQYVEPRDRK